MSPHADYRLNNKELHHDDQSAHYADQAAARPTFRPQHPRHNADCARRISRMLFANDTGIVLRASSEGRMLWDRWHTLRMLVAAPAIGIRARSCCAPRSHRARILSEYQELY